MLAIVRIRGDVNLDYDRRETFNRLGLGKKYTCVVIMKPGEIELGMLKKIKDLVAYGEINEETFEKLIEKRAQLINKAKKIDAKKTAQELEAGKSYKELNLKSYFRLHPPRGGIESKKHFGVGKGVLGNNKEGINKLIGRMLWLKWKNYH